VTKRGNSQIYSPILNLNLGGYSFDIRLSPIIFKLSGKMSAYIIHLHFSIADF